MSRLFTEKEDKLLKKLYAIKPGSHIAKLLGRTPSTVRQRLKKLGLNVPPEKLQEFKNISLFKKGRISPNKGKKIEEFMSAEAIKKLEPKRFKKGQVPHNIAAADGTITIRTFRGIKYKYIRLNVCKWVQLHRHIWEQHNGLIPPMHNVIFKDSNTMNCVIENLGLLSNAELMKRNSIHNLPPELKEIINIGKSLNNKIKKTIKNLQDEKQSKRFKKSHVCSLR